MSADGPDPRWADADEDGFEVPPFLLDPLGVLRRRWPWMLPVLLLGLVATVIAVAMRAPYFAATAKLLISKQQIPVEFVRPTVVDDPLANINAMVGEGLSRQSLVDILDRLAVYPQEGGGEVVPLVERIARMRSAITIAPASSQGQGESLVYDVTFMHPDPEKAAAVANALAAVMMEASIERRGAHARRTTEFLKRNLAEDERELEEASRLVSDYRRKHRGTLPSELETSLRKLDMLAERRESISARIAASENMIATLAGAGRQTKSENGILLDELRRQLAAATAAYTDEHPNVIALRERVARMQEVVRREGSGLGADPDVRMRIASERRNVEQLQSQIVSIEEEIAELDARVDQIPKIAEELAILEQKERAQQEAHLSSLRKVAEAEIAENLETAQQGSRVSLLDSAQVPTQPERNRLKYLLFGLAFSLALSVGVGVLFELLDPVVVDLRQIEGAMGRPALGAMPNMTV